MTVTVDEIEVADPADAWTQAGFTVDPDARCRIGGVRIRLVGRGRGVAPAATLAAGAGIIGWSLRGLPSDGPLDELDGVPTTRSAAATAAPATHANGVTAIDHVVLLSPDLGRTVRSLSAVGVEPRRERNGELGGRPIRQIFFRFGEVIIEAVGSPGTASEGPSTLWGITYVVADIDATASFFGDHTTPVKDAVQPGRRITTLRHQELGMSVRTAMISAFAEEASSKVRQVY
ncbi:MAG: glyoxalase [Mycobacterium sp.]